MMKYISTLVASNYKFEDLRLLTSSEVLVQKFTVMYALLLVKPT